MVSVSALSPSQASREHDAANAPLDIATLGAHVQQTLSQVADERAARRAVAQLAIRLVNAETAAWMTYDDLGHLTIEAETTAGYRNRQIAELSGTLLPLAAKALQTRRVEIQHLPESSVVLIIPVLVEMTRPACLAAILQLSEQPLEWFVVVLQLLAEQVATSYWQLKAGVSENEAHQLAAALDIVIRTAAATSLVDGLQRLCNDLCDYLGAERVLIGLCKSEGRGCKDLAVSGAAPLDRNSEQRRVIQAACDETVIRRRPSHFPASDDADRHLLTAHAKLAEAIGEDVYSIPLATSDGRMLGACIVAGARCNDATPSIDRFLPALAGPMADAIAQLRRADGWRWLHALRAMRKRHPVLRANSLALVAVVTACVLSLPLHYRLRGACELQPAVRRFVAAPFDGIFEKSLAKPGDVVVRGQVLGQMDGRELRIELAGLSADQTRAAKSSDVNRADGKVAAAQIDQLELERLAHKRQLLARRIENLDIKSPIGGLVLTGDLDRSEGVPLTVGQPLYEIAPLDRMFAEIEIPDDEIEHVVEGQRVYVRLDALPGSALEGTLTELHPRSETRNGANVFIAEVMLDNPGEVLRPGMKGTAKIVTARRSLAWILFHRPWNWLASLLF